AKGYIELEIAEQFAALLKPSQDLVRGAPARRLHKTVHRAFEPAFTGDLGLLLIGVIALHGLEVLAEKFVVIEVALDEFALVFAGFLLGLGKIWTANAELREHNVRRFGTVVFPMELLTALDYRQPHFPRPVGEHHHMRAQLGGGDD